MTSAAGNLVVHSFWWGDRRLHYSPTLNRLMAEKPGQQSDPREVEAFFQSPLPGASPRRDPEAMQLPQGRGVGEAPLRGIDLVLTHACNLDCDYCSFYRGRAIAPVSDGHMTRETAAGALAMIEPSLRAGAKARIRFTGGEPLLNRQTLDWVLSQGLTAYRSGGGRHRVFSLMTNGVALTEEVAEHLLNYPISIQVSLDGPAATHNAHRRYRRGHRYSHARVEAAAVMLKRLTGELHVAAVWMPNEASILERVRYFASIGVDTVRMAHGNIQLSGQAASSAGGEVFEQLIDQLREYASYFVGECRAGHRPIYDPFTPIVERLRGQYRLARSCNPLGTGNRTVDTDGRIYACYGFVGLGEHALGNVWQGQQADSLARWAAKRAEALAECRGCWAWPLCRGGDLCERFDLGLAERPDTRWLCEAQRKRVEIALGLCVSAPAPIRKDGP